MTARVRPSADSGAATVLLVALLAVMIMAAGLALQVVRIGVARARTAAAADLAALAAAGAGQCEPAAAVGSANGASRVSCEPRGSDFLVRAETDIVLLARSTYHRHGVGPCGSARLGFRTRWVRWSGRLSVDVG